MLFNNSFLIPAYLCSLDEYQTAKNIACKHCIVIIPYLESHYILETKEFSLTILAKDYYNIV